MIIQKRENMVVKIENGKDDKKLVVLNQNDGYHCQTALLTKKQACKMAKALLK